MGDILKNPTVISLLIGGITFVVMNHFNVQRSDKMSRNDMKKRKQRSKSLFGEPKEVNILVSVLVTIILWYYLYSQQKNDIPALNINPIDNPMQSLSSSESRKSYNLLGKGLQLPNGQQLPDIFHKII